VTDEQTAVERLEELLPGSLGFDREILDAIHDVQREARAEAAKKERARLRHTWYDWTRTRMSTMHDVGHMEAAVFDLLADPVESHIIHEWREPTPAMIEDGDWSRVCKTCFTKETTDT